MIPGGIVPNLVFLASMLYLWGASIYINIMLKYDKLYIIKRKLNTYYKSLGITDLEG